MLDLNRTDAGFDIESAVLMIIFSVISLLVGYLLYCNGHGVESARIEQWIGRWGFNLLAGPEIGPGALWWAMLGAAGGRIVHASVEGRA